ncbi:MAG: LrgB family protein [Lachnospiraceae bacterium]|nr:LrgB family protein [Lachnospiraceae bacterium]
MNLNDFLAESVFFGIVLSLAAYKIGFEIQRKYKKVFLNPLLISIVIIISFLLVTGVSYETFQKGASRLSYFLTPVTVCLAVPLYKQLQVLKENVAAILISIFLGCLSHAGILIGITAAFGMDKQLLFSLMPKSITTAIALGVSDELGGIAGITVIGVMVAGISGAVVGPVLLKLFRIRDPIAQGLALGSSAHAIGTSKAVELGEVQAAMSSLAIVVTGIMTVVIVPWVAGLL